ncbi:hypothetical protein CK203_042787 [Vitis vinifera]|uniref:Uncharacterized protein n=1 Tax=Vitis vinifera TaxID=29760 RepID=A0A438HQV0_VITVI|nr:hypothetical protein CK203_042787 [Vitis vinifera]
MKYIWIEESPNTASYAAEEGKNRRIARVRDQIEKKNNRGTTGKVERTFPKARAGIGGSDGRNRYEGWLVGVRRGWRRKHVAGKWLTRPHVPAREMQLPCWKKTSSEKFARKVAGGECFLTTIRPIGKLWGLGKVTGMKHRSQEGFPELMTRGNWKELGRLWIHAASKVPDSDTIKAMENFYREIYAVNGITDLKFPEHYPVSRLLGCVEVVGCVKCEELACWKEVRLEAQTEFCWLCEQPQHYIDGLSSPELMQKLIIPFEMPAGTNDHLFSCFDGSKAAEDKKPEGLLAAIAGARAAATQFSKNDNHQSITMQGQDADVSTRTREESEEFEKLDSELIKRA